MVNCRGCTACCRSGLEVEVEDSGLESDERGILRLSETGACIYLTESGCSVYTQRPPACREFDCRNVVREFSKGEIVLALLRPDLPLRELFEAGVTRLEEDD